MYTIKSTLNSINKAVKQNISMQDENIQVLRAQQKKHIPVVLSIDEAKSIILNRTGIYQVMLKLMYPKSISSF